MELLTQIAPYFGITVAINFAIGILKAYFKWYESIKAYIASIVAIAAIVCYFVYSDFALFTAIACTPLTWSVAKKAMEFARKLKK